ncbi:hypothetical protein SAMN04490239_0872 [Rhodococcus koreensis]|uniref:Uncharacterized protein n=2 Tax=Rhodococcus koreensis TaxID=99653 RepID=A0A1H4KTJ9_9NOCA|nr:hypothetical protein SAMN04490239_0872 [Rhodococcus koreensis]
MVIKMTSHDAIRRWIAEQMCLDLEVADPAVLAYLDEVTAVAEAGYVRSLLKLESYRPLVG